MPLHLFLSFPSFQYLAPGPGFSSSSLPSFNRSFILSLRLPTMQFSLRTSTLLAGLIVLLSLHAVDSLFVSIRRPEPQFFTLPLRRIQQRSDIHPQIVRDQIFPTVLNIPIEHFGSSCKCALIAVFVDWQR